MVALFIVIHSKLLSQVENVFRSMITAFNRTNNCIYKPLPFICNTCFCGTLLWPHTQSDGYACGPQTLLVTQHTIWLLWPDVHRLCWSHTHNLITMTRCLHLAGSIHNHMTMTRCPQTLLVAHTQSHNYDQMSIHFAGGTQIIWLLWPDVYTLCWWHTQSHDYDQMFTHVVGGTYIIWLLWPDVHRLCWWHTHNHMTITRCPYTLLVAHTQSDYYDQMSTDFTGGTHNHMTMTRCPQTLLVVHTQSHDYDLMSTNFAGGTHTITWLWPDVHRLNGHNQMTTKMSTDFTNQWDIHNLMIMPSCTWVNKIRYWSIQSLTS